MGLHCVWKWDSTRLVQINYLLQNKVCVCVCERERERERSRREREVDRQSAVYCACVLYCVFGDGMMTDTDVPVIVSMLWYFISRSE